MERFNSYTDFVSSDNLDEVLSYIENLQEVVDFVETAEEELEYAKSLLRDELYIIYSKSYELSVINHLKFKQSKVPKLAELRRRISTAESNLIKAKKEAIKAQTKINHLQEAILIQEG